VSLRAPIAVAVEVRSEAGRVFRLSANVGEDGVRFSRPLPFEPGRPVEVRFRLPDGELIGLAGHVGREESDEASDDQPSGAEPRPREVAFRDPPAEARVMLRRYVQARLELPA
jgi:PilZ domain-containing protein